MPIASRIRWGLAIQACTVLLLGIGVAANAPAQQSDVLIDVSRAEGDLGLGGHIRRGDWAPMRVSLTNQSAQLRDLRLMWLLKDNDGDRLIAQRHVTLDALREGSRVWLYACPPMSTRPPDPGWRLAMADNETGQILQTLPIYPDPNRMLALEETAIGLMSSVTMGLDTYTNRATTHEPIRLITGLNLTTLPDRWYGMSVTDTLVWSWRDGEGGDPNDAAYTADAQDALREWIRRGGHLVIVLPPIGEPWSGSPLTDLMPVGKDQMRQVTDLPPVSLGSVVGAERAPIAMTVFDVRDGDGVEVIDRDRQGNPYIIAKRYGFGRVTLVGVDLGSPTVIRMGLPNGKVRVWNKVLGWTSPAMTRSEMDAQIRNSELSRPDVRPTVELGDTWLKGAITMTNTAAPILLGAIVLFLIYWLAAGPGAFGVLKAKKAQRHSWTAFVAVVGVFTLVTWAAALAVRPSQVNVAHFSVATVDGRTGTAHVQGWASMFIPTFGDVTVALDPDDEHSRDTLASPGLFDQAQGTEFPDTQTYVFDAASPNEATVPMRATSKQFTFDYRGRLATDVEGVTHDWGFPAGDVAISSSFWPDGDLTHQLPGPLEDLLIIYCPGDGEMPWVWRRRDPWEPGQPLRIERPTQALRLSIEARGDYAKDRQWVAEGYLGILIGMKTGLRLPTAQQALMPDRSDRDIKQQAELLSFFNLAPPPNYRDTDFAFNRPTTYLRRFGKDLDLSELTTGRRLILIGHLQQSPLPAPITVGGRPVEKVNSSSWTVLRWVYDL